MSGGTRTFVRDGRRSQQANGNAMNAAALQGANIAFNARSAHQRSQSVTQNSRRPVKPASNMDIVRPKQHVDELELEAESKSEMPEVGLVMNRIKAFSGSSGSGNNAVPSSVKPRRSADTLRSESPQIQAAALAAIRSSSRTSQAASLPAVSPIRKANTGASPSRRAVISPPPKPDFLSARSPGKLHAPAPVRKIPAVAHSLANIADEENSGASLNRLQPGISGFPKSSNLTESTKKRPKPQIVFDSPPARKPSTSPLRQCIVPSQAGEDEPSLATPASKKKPGTSTTEGKRSRPEVPKKVATHLREEKSTSIPRSPRNTPGNNRDASQAETPVMRNSNAQPSFDEVSIPGSSHSLISRQNTGNTESTSGMTKESLANAIIASSLASSRAPSPYNPPPPLPPPRRSRSHSLLHPGDILKKDVRTTPSPPKGLRQTLRDPPKADEEANKSANRRHLIKKHPNKHHEGDRRRWRQEVTETARKRYEGVWAANKGIFVPPEKMLYQLFPDLSRTVMVSELVLHLVVRDIWKRSRLPDYTLEQIWNLVDRKGIGMLAREEFVVGLWLIDETLRGHKIPIKVPQSVWDSVRHTPGIKVPQEF